MKILEAAQLTSMVDNNRAPLKREQTSALKLAEALFAEAEQRGEPFLYHTPSTWAKRWMPSKKFVLLRVPLNAAALPCEPKGPNLVQKKIHAREDNPIILDLNKNQVGATLSGFTPKVIVLDGKHRFKAAALRGDSFIVAWVGELAAEAIKKAVAERPRDRRAPKSNDTKRTTITETLSMREMMAQGVDKLHASFQAAVRSGYKPRMTAKAPEGCENVVQELKKKYGEDSSTPFQLAWYLHDKGSCG